MNTKSKMIAAFILTLACSNVYAAQVIGVGNDSITLHFDSLQTLSAPTLADSLGLISQADYISGTGTVMIGATVSEASNPQVEAVFSSESLMADYCYRLARRAKRKGFAFEIKGAAMVMPVYKAPPGVATPANRSAALLNQSSSVGSGIVGSGIIDPNPTNHGLAAHFSHIDSCKVLKPSAVNTPGNPIATPM